MIDKIKSDRPDTYVLLRMTYEDGELKLADEEVAAEGLDTILCGELATGHPVIAIGPELLVMQPRQYSPHPWG